MDSAVKPAHSLFDFCLKARIIAATLAVMGIGSVDDECHDVPKAEDSKSSKTDYLFKLASKVVDDYVLDGSGNELLAKSLVDDEQDMSSTDVRDTSSTDESASKFQDDMFSYQRALLEYGLLLYNFKDSVNEGDGTRIIRCWKFFLLHLKNSKSSTKYALKALYLMFQVYALLSPKAAHELIWNRSVKLRNNRGGNIPLDLQLEFYNRILKDAVKQLGPNASQRSMDRICKSMSVTKDLMDRFDLELKIHKRSGRHVASSSDNDLKKVVGELVIQRAMHYTPGRQYQHFTGMKSSFLWNFNIQDLHKWINNHKKYIEIRRRAR